jgi:tape measure domain-containing protein
MSFQLAEAYVQLSRRGFEGVMTGINQVKSGLGSLVSFATGPLGVAMAGIGAGMGVAGLVKMASDAEQLEIAFGTMLGSTDKAKMMITDLNQFAAKTPFEMPGITQAARSLMSFGTSQDQVIPLLRVLGDVSAGTGKDLSELAVIFGQISATGKLTGGDLMQLTNAGVPMLKTLADQLGKTTGEVKAMVEGGEISSGMVTKAFQQMSSEGGLFSNMMEKQSGTLGGLWSTLSDTIGQGALAMGQALVDGFDLKSVVANLTSFVERVRGEWMPSIVAGFQWAKENMIQPMFSAIGSMTTAVWEFVQDFDLYWEYAYTSVGNWMNNIYQVVSTNLRNNWTIAKWFFGNFGQMASNIFNGVPKLFSNMVTQIQNHWQSLMNFFKTGKLEFDFSPMVDSLNTVFEGIEMPKLEVAQTDVLRSDLDNIAKRLAERQEQRQKSAKQEAKETQKTQGDTLKIEEGVTQEKKKQKAEFSSLSDLADKMRQEVIEQSQKDKKGKSEKASTEQQVTGALAAGAALGGMGSIGAMTGLAAGAGAISNQQSASRTGEMAALQKQASLLQSLITLASGSGLKIAPQQTAVQVPEASVRFGATGG